MRDQIETGVTDRSEALMVSTTTTSLIACDKLEPAQCIVSTTMHSSLQSPVSSADPDEEPDVRSR